MHQPSITLAQLESHLWESANILRGPVDAADFKTYIFPLLFFKRTRERAQSFLKPEHQQRILGAFKAFADAPGFARVATLGDLHKNAGNLSIPLYVKRQSASAAAAAGDDQPASLAEAWDAWQESGRAFWQQMDALVETLDGLGVAKGASDA